MATVGSLLVVLRGDTSPFQRSFKGAEDFTSKFAGTFTNKILGSAAIIKTLDAAIDSLADSFEAMRVDGVAAFDSLIAAGESFVDSLAQIPVAGGLGRILATGFDAILPGRSIAEQRRGDAAVDAQIAASSKALADADKAENAAKAEGLRLTESLMTAQERYAASVQRAGELLRAGHITLGTYNRVLADTPAALDLTGAPLNEMIGALQEQAATLGLTARQLSVYRAAQQGAGEAALAAVNAVHDLIDAQQAALDVQAAANRVIEETRSPLENYEQRITELNDLLEAGRISWEVYGRAVRQARQQLESAAGARNLESALVASGRVASIDVGAAGSFAGRNVIDRSRDQVADNTKRQLELTQRELEQLAAIEQAIRTNSITITVQEVTI